MRRILLGGLLVYAALPLGCEIKTDTVAEKGTTITPTPLPMEARPAEVGVGIKGQSLKNETGIGKIIAQPAMTLFAVKEKIPFEIEIPAAMNLFKAGEGEGRAPSTHEEFMEKIIKFNRIKLPKLPEGQEYRYRPEEEQLWVQPIQ